MEREEREQLQAEERERQAFLEWEEQTSGSSRLSLSAIKAPGGSSLLDEQKKEEDEVVARARKREEEMRALRAREANSRRDSSSSSSNTPAQPTSPTGRSSATASASTSPTSHKSFSRRLSREELGDEEWAREKERRASIAADAASKLLGSSFSRGPEEFTRSSFATPRNEALVMARKSASVPAGGHTGESELQARFRKAEEERAEQERQEREREAEYERQRQRSAAEAAERQRREQEEAERAHQQAEALRQQQQQSQSSAGAASKFTRRPSTDDGDLEYRRELRTKGLCGVCEKKVYFLEKLEINEEVGLGIGGGGILIRLVTHPPPPLLPQTAVPQGVLPLL